MNIGATTSRDTPGKSRARYTTVIALEEDPDVRLVTTIVDCSLADLRIEMPMTVVYRALDFPGVSREVVAPMFAPAPRTS